MATLEHAVWDSTAYQVYPARPVTVSKKQRKSNKQSVQYAKRDDLPGSATQQQVNQLLMLAGIQSTKVRAGKQIRLLLAPIRHRLDAFIADMLSTLDGERVTALLAHTTHDLVGDTRPLLSTYKPARKRPESPLEDSLIPSTLLALGGQRKDHKRSRGARTVPVLEETSDGKLQTSYKMTAAAWEAASEVCQREYWTALATSDQSRTSDEPISLEDASESEKDSVHVKNSWPTIEQALWSFAPAQYTQALERTQLQEEISGQEECMADNLRLEFLSWCIRIGLSKSYRPIVKQARTIALKLKGVNTGNTPQYNPSWYAGTAEGKTQYEEEIALALLDATQAGLTLADAVAALRHGGILTDGLTIDDNQETGQKISVRVTDGWTQQALLLAPAQPDDLLGGLSQAELFSLEDRQADLSIGLENVPGR